MLLLRLPTPPFCFFFFICYNKASCWGSLHVLRALCDYNGSLCICVIRQIRTSRGCRWAPYRLDAGSVSGVDCFWQEAGRPFFHVATAGLPASWKMGVYALQWLLFSVTVHRKHTHSWNKTWKARLRWWFAEWVLVLIFGEAFTALQVIVIISCAERFQGQFPNNLPSLDRNLWKETWVEIARPCVFSSMMQHIFPLSLSLSLFVFHFSPSLPVCGVWSLNPRCLSHSNTTLDLGPGQYREWPPELLYLIMIVNIDGQEMKGCQRKETTLLERHKGRKRKQNLFSRSLLFAPVLACIGVFPRNFRQLCQLFVYFFCNDLAFFVWSSDLKLNKVSLLRNGKSTSMYAPVATPLPQRPVTIVGAASRWGFIDFRRLSFFKAFEEDVWQTNCSASIDWTCGSSRGLVATDFVWFHL